MTEVSNGVNLEEDKFKFKKNWRQKDKKRG